MTWDFYSNGFGVLCKIRMTFWASVIKAIHGHNGGIHADSRHSSNQGCQVVNRISSNDWNSFLRRPARGGIEAAQLSSLQNLIKDVVLSDCCDTWSWSPDSSKGFTVASVRHMIDARFLDVSPTATRWIRDIPIKINVFLWRLSLNKLPSRMNLDKKGIDVDSILCPVCNDDVETVNHLFFSCDMAKDLWSWRDGGSLIFLFV
ncbi:RNA-directed DNA polymerase, eukaryota, reverse transcriptase zinc-binding domain protein [Tanacetum coccineum]